MINDIKTFVNEPMQQPIAQDHRDQIIRMIPPESIVTRLSLKERKKILKAKMRKKAKR